MFKDNKYQPVKEIISKDIVSIATQYTLLDELNNPSIGADTQVINSHSRYADQLMESILLYLQPAVEFVSGLQLLPTYSYYRVYRPGHELKPHTDRPSCEISVTVSFGRNYQSENGKYDWPMFVEGNPVVMEPGDGIVYMGMEAEHWREKFIAPEYSYHVQGFFHYVNANGPHADHALDKRLYIGQQRDIYKPTYTTPVKPYITYTK